MKFGRNILLLLGIISLLSAALVLTRMHKPKDLPMRGALLYPLNMESVVEISWDVLGPDGKSCQMHLTRSGEFWTMQHPYPGVRCDIAAVTSLLDAANRMRILNQLGKAEQTAFTPERYLTLKTPDREITCAFGEVLPMELSQTLIETQGVLAAVEAAYVAQLPTTAAAMRTRAILPITPERIRQLEWRAPDQPFTRARKMQNGNWAVTLPFPFETKPDLVSKALEALTDPTAVKAYIRPADVAPLATLPGIGHELSTDSTLSAYGLEEESALRLTVLVNGVRDGFTLRFGKADPAHPGNVFCLLDGYQAIVSVPATLKAIFGAQGPFVTNFRDLPILGDLPDPDRLVIQPSRGEATIELAKEHGLWGLVRPTALPAEHPVLRQLLSALSTLSGDLIEGEPGSATPLVELTLSAGSKPDESWELAIYDAPTSEHLRVYRKKPGRFYQIARNELPDFLLKANLDRLLIDRTIFSLPAETIRRIAVLHRDGTSVAIRRRADGLAWETESPVGAYINESILDEWLTRFAELKATDILNDTPSTFGSLQPYGLEMPYLRLTLDLTGGEEGLRRILLIGTPDLETGTAPAMVQGRPVLYRLNEDDLAAFQLLPAQREEEY